MHELSIVNSIMKTLEMEFGDQKMEELSAIHLKVGPLSNIEPRLLHNAFYARHECGSKYHKVQLNIESTSIKVLCNQCSRESLVENYRFICSYCDLPSKNIIQGEEMLIHKVEFSDP